MPPPAHGVWRTAVPQDSVAAWLFEAQTRAARSAVGSTVASGASSGASGGLAHHCHTSSTSDCPSTAAHAALIVGGDVRDAIRHVRCETLAIQLLIAKTPGPSGWGKPHPRLHQCTCLPPTPDAATIPYCPDKLVPSAISEPMAGSTFQFLARSSHCLSSSLPPVQRPVSSFSCAGVSSQDPALTDMRRAYRW